MIYEYECEDCGKKFDVHTMLNEKETTCRYCGCVAVKIPSTSNFILKGEGFHKNDYKEKK